MSAKVAKRRGKRRWRRVAALLIGLVVGVVLLEAGCWLVVTTGLISARVPSYALGASAGTFWSDLSPDFGVWHPANVRYHHHKACFDVVYESNSYGARDVERPVECDQPRVLVLGDSFMEGYGVDLGQRMSNVLERQTGIPHLNFGIGGKAGSTHAYALYSKFASRFRHDAVLVAILPENDFDDDAKQADRYLPFWQGSYPTYRLCYSLPSVEQSLYRYSSSQAEFEFEHWLREFSYTKNVFDLLYSAHKQRRMRRRLSGDAGLPDSRFFRYSREEFDRMRHSYEQLAAIAAPRPVVLFTIPRPGDLAAYRQHGHSPLDDELTAWAAGVDNVHFVPLLPALLRRHGDDLARLFLSCDPHWNGFGHRAAAEIVTAQAGDVLQVR